MTATITLSRPDLTAILTACEAALPDNDTTMPFSHALADDALRAVRAAAWGDTDTACVTLLPDEHDALATLWEVGADMLADLDDGQWYRIREALR